MGMSAAPGTVLLDVRDVDVVRGRRTVLRGVSVGVASRECVAVVGPNGAGKSSLVGAVTGELPLAAGTVDLGGEPAQLLSSRERARRRAVLTQHSAVAFGFTTREVVAMARDPWRGTDLSADDPAVVDRALADADVVQLADRPVNELSGGELARVAIARTLAQTAPLLIWDEPMAALDLQHQALVLARLTRHLADGGGALLVEHDLTLVSRVATRVVILSDGAVAAQGAPHEVFTEETIRAVYGADIEIISVTDDAGGVLPIVVPRVPRSA
jgi:iron complex transport system ATP-binding protein